MSITRDGGGQLSRKELATGLFAIGIWLHPDETQALVEVNHPALAMHVTAFVEHMLLYNKLCVCVCV